jgi:hypothetical protein
MVRKEYSKIRVPDKADLASDVSWTACSLREGVGARTNRKFGVNFRDPPPPTLFL